MACKRRLVLQALREAGRIPHWLSSTVSTVSPVSPVSTAVASVLPLATRKVACKISEHFSLIWSTFEYF